SKIVEVSTARDGLLQVKQGRLDAFGLTTITLKNILKKNPGSGLELTKPFTPVVDGKPQYGCGGAVFRTQDNDLRLAFNRELKKLRQSGELLKIIEPFGFGPETTPPANLTTASLCKGT